MRGKARRARDGARLTFVSSLLVAAAVAVALLVPGTPAQAPAIVASGPGRAGAAALRRPEGGLAPATVPSASGKGQPFGGIAAAGALFTMSAGRLAGHFCSAAVVHSARGDLVVTAAHCLTGRHGPLAFVPGYAAGREPYGIWPVTDVYTDQAWQASRDPDDDVAFLRLADVGGVPVEDITGAEQLGIVQSGSAPDGSAQPGGTAGAPAGPLGLITALPVLVQVVGYPDDAGLPLLCAGWARHFSPAQLQFDCDGYSDGSSGGPFLADVSAATGEGTVIGVIGGYQQGGDTPDVSYAAVIRNSVTALFRTAEAGG